MFFIGGISQKSEKIEFNQVNVCEICDKFSNIEVYKTYWYFSFFFIPIIKWNKEYFVKLNCCQKISKLDNEIGLKIEKGEITSIDMKNLDFKINSLKTCLNCGFKTEKDYTYCPKCSNKLS
jgi:hypothetical protein